MKKTLAFILLLLMTIIQLNAADTAITHEATQSLQIGGFYKEETAISVEPINSSIDNIGMPFNLMGADVAAAPGRPVAYWNAKSNMDSIEITVTAEALEHSSGSASLPYVLRLYYTTDGGASYQYQEVDSGTQGSILEIEDADGPLSLDGMINFHLTENSNIANDILYPEGDYNATVTLTIEEGQS